MGDSAARGESIGIFYATGRNKQHSLERFLGEEYLRDGWSFFHPREDIMIWELKDKGVARPKDLPDHIERRLRFALSRFDGRIQKVLVFLQDQNGPKGGIDKVCRVLVKTRGCGTVVAAVVDSDWIVAVDRATTRIGQAVTRQIERLRDQHDPRPSTRFEQPRFTFGRLRHS
jgi:ribosome-associated translation inhibitor RaiA